MSDAVPEPTPQTQPAFSGRPPGPPKVTARALENSAPEDPGKTVYLLDKVTARALEDSAPEDPGKTVYLLDPMVVKDLAAAIGVKPFKVVADLLGLKQFKKADEEIDFETASIIARKHGYRAERPPPGALVL